MKRFALALLLALSLAACGQGGALSSTGSAYDISIVHVGSAGEIVRFTIDHDADCVIHGHGDENLAFPAGTHVYDVPAGTTMADDPVWCD